MVDVCGDLVDGDDDGEIDEDCDNDGDGYTAGEADGGYLSGGDCDDEDATVNPGAAEVCDDGIDNDGDIDEADSDSDCSV